MAQCQLKELHAYLGISVQMEHRHQLHANLELIIQTMERLSVFLAQLVITVLKTQQHTMTLFVQWDTIVRLEQCIHNNILALQERSLILLVLTRKPTAFLAYQENIAPTVDLRVLLASVQQGGIAAEARGLRNLLI